MDGPNAVTQTRALKALNPSGTSRRVGAGRQVGTNALVYLFLIAVALVILCPYLISVLASFKTSQQFVTESPTTLPDPVTLGNYVGLVTGRIDMISPIVVTVQMVIVLVIGQMTGSVLAAYAFSFLRFPGRDLLFWSFLGTLMVPNVVTIVPLYLMLSSWGLRDTFWGLVIPYVLGSPYAIFLLRQNFLRLPTELLDAARLDGCGQLRVLRHVVLPANVPILTTLLLITVVTHWNSFLWPLVITSSPTWRVLTVATSTLQGQYSENWTLVLAATTLALVPLIVLFVVFQKQIVRSIGVTGIR